MAVVIEHKSILTQIKTIYANFLTRIYKGVFGNLSENDLTEENVSAILKEKWAEETSSYISERMQSLETAIANGTIKQTLRGTALRNLKEGLTGPAKTKFLEDVATRATSISDTVKDQIRAVAKEVIEKDGKLLDFQAALKTRFKEDLTQGKADVIARTEYRSAYTYGQNDAVEKLEKKGYKVTRIWRTSGTNVRSSHEIDGEERAVGETFSNGLLYPMEPGAPIEEVINCNCSLEIVTEEK